MELSKTQVDQIFDTAESWGDAAVGLYRLAFPDWTRINALNGWPKVGKELAEYIYSKFIKCFGRVGAFNWMNKGFSGHSNEHLGPWEISLEGVEVEYND